MIMRQRRCDQNVLSLFLLPMNGAGQVTCFCENMHVRIFNFIGFNPVQTVDVKFCFLLEILAAGTLEMLHEHNPRKCPSKWAHQMPLKAPCLHCHRFAAFVFEDFEVRYLRKNCKWACCHKCNTGVDADREMSLVILSHNSYCSVLLHAHDLAALRF